MKLLISIYYEERDSGIAKLAFSRWLMTDPDIAEIENRLQLQDGFRSEFTYGQTLSFLDLYLFTDCEEMIARVQAIPSEETPRNLEKKAPTFLRVEAFDPGNADEAAPLIPSRMFLYTLDRYECGASGYAAVVCWMAAHPIHMIFFAGMVYDFAKYLLCAAWGKITGKRRRSTTSKSVILQTKSFYRNFEKLTRIPPEDCQIIKMKQKKPGKLNITVRTAENERYQIVARPSGKIEEYRQF